MQANTIAASRSDLVVMPVAIMGTPPRHSGQREALIRNPEMEAQSSPTNAAYFTPGFQVRALRAAPE